MKSPQSFLQDEQHNDVEPVLAIRRAQADAIAHALKVMRTLPHHKADLALSTLAFELVGNGPLSSATAQPKVGFVGKTMTTEEIAKVLNGLWR